jgi:hypothetical protein
MLPPRGRCGKLALDARQARCYRFALARPPSRGIPVTRGRIAAMPTPIRAVGLLSGGLDSTLAAKLVLDQGIEVVGLHLTAPTACRTGVAEVAAQLGIRLVTRAKGDAFLRLVRNPRFGWGRNMNPCLDCRVFMFGMARELMAESGASFLFTGEVTGQRPMSQQRAALDRIDRESGLEGWVVRPLSALRLPETGPEKRGWLDRSKLLGLTGRGRHEQLALAATLGLRHFESPGGGCLLTEPGFARRLRDLFEHVDADGTEAEDVELLRIGRHVRVDRSTKVVLGRDAAENARLPEFENARRWRVEPTGFRGPTALVCGPRDEAALGAAIALIGRHAGRPDPRDEVRWWEDGTERRRALGAAASPPVLEIRGNALPVLQPGVG